MKIIIAGAGEVGTHLAKLLSKEEQDIILIDADIEKLQWIDSTKGYEAMGKFAAEKLK